MNPAQTFSVYQVALESGILLAGSALLSGICLYLSIRLARWRWQRVANATAEITRIRPYYRKPSVPRTRFVEIEYSFKHRRYSFTGSSIVPIRHFIADLGPVIVQDPRVDVPVLHCDLNARIVGEEAIEHHLLEGKSRVQVRFLLRDPDRNFLASSEGRRKSIVRKRSRHS
ncbi:MAG: hypothetical protein CMN76_16660 [Spirochaetaceae bacterium]|nr:hypothetical protein [Spirochaetaceae bacterium]